MTFDTPQAAEDAFYDALEEGSIDALMAVWDDADDSPAAADATAAAGPGRDPRDVPQAFQALGGIDIQAAHLQWLTWGDTAVHLLEEQVADRTAGSPRRSTR